MSDLLPNVLSRSVLRVLREVTWKCSPNYFCVFVACALNMVDMNVSNFCSPSLPLCGVNKSVHWNVSIIWVKLLQNTIFFVLYFY